ncbi:Indoleamine 2,3-dioxygenase [Laetiporus sulphureus 93-53]|uniref:Indoleamine 2,3-dioxygenase n=1 Tax=Laetiporus sulphureus 93-53 TaxID=1314785 RepID=A0A165C5X6_9APHY|nr:Indoleamine 2,3-dioxygenase [Laetiporus sulphureus 93-53]KZT02261.1 Indoleamine 2,3-dioxygenase [Laetiporus sulphureus 93-53]
MNFLHLPSSDLPPDHFLALPRPDHGLAAAGTPDTSTLAAHDFDVDTRTGFMPPQPPLARLPQEWEPWEAALDEALNNRLQLAEKRGLTEVEEAQSDRWRKRVKELPILETDGLKRSELLLRRAHHVLAWIMHFYVHTIPVTFPEIRIPPPIAVPFLQVSSQLQLPPILTYSDDVLYNWAYKKPTSPAFPIRPPALDNLRCLTLFSGTRDEEEFYLASARIELRGVEALSLMSAMMDEAFLGDATAIRRITSYLHTLAKVINELTTILAAVREGCDPDVFYNDIRPWFRGADSDSTRKWIFEGLELDPTLQRPSELSGPSAGQSSLIHALDIFLGVDRYSHSNFPIGKSAKTSQPASESSSGSSSAAPTASFSSAPGTTSVPFLIRMQSYMPRHHRAFLRHLSANPRPIRALVESSNDPKLLEAYNEAVNALKMFRDAHVRVVAAYILGPSRRAGGSKAKQAKGTGGTDAFMFVKGVRDQTTGAMLKPET